MILKREYFYQKVEEGLNRFIILGVPSKELQDTYFQGADLLELLSKYKINYELGSFDNTGIEVYFPYGIKDRRHVQLTELCAISVRRYMNVEDIRNIEKLFDRVIEYYQNDIPPVIINKILGIHPEPITFSDMLMIIPEKSQVAVAQKIGKSKQAITDIKTGKNNMTLEVLSSLMKAYPLLPWREFVESSY